MYKIILLLGLTCSTTYANVVNFDRDDARKFEESSPHTCQNCNLSYYNTKPSNDYDFVKLTGSLLSGSRLGQINENWSNADFSYSSGVKITFIANQLYGANFSNVHYNFVSFSTRMLSMADFSNSTLTNSRFPEGAIIDGAKFNNAHLDDSTFYSAKLDGADFSGSTLNNIIFIRASLAKTHFKFADTTGADFSYANFCHSDISGDQLSKAKSVSCAIKPDCIGKFVPADGTICY
jgi:uncharacterized protein YjbI with pentapeptide repeats